MGLLDGLFRANLRAGTPAPDDDYWYGPVGTMTAAGLKIDSEGAKKISAWYRGRDILATSLAMLPLKMFRKQPGDGPDDASIHPLHDLLHRKPNVDQDAFRWKRTAMFHLIDFGNAYNFIVGGGRGVVDQLRPIHPSYVTPKFNESTGRTLYEVRTTTGQAQIYTSDAIFHLCGASDDGVCGKGILQYARESLGLGAALDSYASRLFSQGSLHGGTISVPGLLDPEASKRMAASFVTSQKTWHMPKVLEQGATYAEATLTPEDSQFILSRKFTVNDIARWLGLPAHMLGDLERSTNNNIEHQGQEFVTYSLGGWLSLWEFAINDQLVTNPDRYYAEFVRDALVRGDIETRWESYQKGVTTGTVTRNEVRVKENMKKLPGLDTPLDPQNITGRPGASTEQPARRAQPADDRGRAIVVAAAERLLRTETAFVEKTAVACADDMDAFVQRVTDFYATHAGFVERTLLLPLADAKAYCSAQASQIVDGNWVEAVAQWRTEAYARGLAALALDEIAEVA